MTTLNAKQAAAAVKQYGGVRKAAKALGVPYSTFGLRLKGIVSKPPTAPSPAPASARVGFTRDDFRQKYDKSFIVPARIREALKKLGPNRYLPEGEFIRLAGISPQDMSVYRNQFEDDHVVTVERSKRLWCGSKALAAEFRGDSNNG